MSTVSLNYIIADDDELYRDYVLLLLQNIEGIRCVAECGNALETREKILQLKPDFLLLDIEMPGLSGVQLVKSLKTPPLVIFITSHLEFAVDAFDVDAIDYIVKPVTQERLLRSIDKVKTLAALQAENTNKEVFKQESDCFFIKDKNIFTRYNYTDVLYIEATGNFSTFCLCNNEKKLALAGLAQLEQQLPAEKFMRISRTHIVNVQHVTAIDTSAVIYMGKIQLQAGKTYSDLILNKITEGHIIKRVLK